MAHRNRLRRCTRIAVHSRPRAGTTLVEQIVILAMVGVLTALVVRSIGQQLDKLAVRGAAREARDVFASAREFAVARGVRTAVQIDPLIAELSAHASADTIAVRRLGVLHGVTVSTSRDSMAYSPSGLGYGASNLRIIVVKRAAAETVTISRLGRVR
ncbi:MAG: hypothetical protein ABI120_23000 [Gemmatimonadaceae bacterium]